MRKTMVLAAVVAALGMVSQPTEARDRGFGSRHFSGHAALKLHLRHHGFKFHHGGSAGKPWAFRSRRFGHFDHPRFASKFGHAPHFQQRHFGHFRRPALVLKFGNGDFVLRFGDVPHFKHRHFGHKRHHYTLFFGLDLPRQFRPWPDRGFDFEDRHKDSGHRRSIPGFQGGHRSGLPHGAPPEALLEELEQMGFRHVPELLRARDR